MRAHQEVDVVVVGAGPVGLVLAAGLAQLGVTVRIVDRASSSKRQARAAVIWPRAAEALQDIGALEPFVQLGNRLGTVAVHAAGRRLGQLALGQHLDSIVPWPLVIEQHDTERLLVEALAGRGIEVEWGCEVTAIAEYRDHVSVTVEPAADGASTGSSDDTARWTRRTSAEGQRVDAEYVVGCDGTSSVVRKAAGIDYVGRRRRNLQVLQINATAAWNLDEPESHGWFFLEPNASLGVFAIPGGGYRFFCFTTDPDPGRTRPPAPAEMRELVARMTRQPRMALTPTEPYWVNRARFQDRLAATLRKGRVLLAGDAAHAWAPIGGHGMNTGIRGAHNLAWKLAAVVHRAAPEALLDTYDVEQRAAAVAVMSEMRFNVLELPLPHHLYWPAILAMPAVLASEPARRSIERRLSDLDAHHRNSPLSVDRLVDHRWRRRLPRAGDRLPDLPARVDGRAPRHLHHLLGYDRWSLLTNSLPDLPRLRRLAAPYPVTVHHVEGGRREGAGEATALHLALVRPDRHIGYLSAPTDINGLRTYLDTHFTTGTSTR